MRRTFLAIPLVMLVAGVAVVSARPPQAEPKRPLRTYSYAETNAMMVPMTLTVARDGTWESMEQTVAPSERGSGMHIRLLYDFAAHKLYSIDLNGAPCTVVTYTSPMVPPIYDPISGAEDSAADFEKALAIATQKETVNGIATKVMEAPSQDGQGKVRMWIHETLRFPVKMVLIGNDGKQNPLLEVRNLSFARPSADLFVPPQNCKALAGETNVSGGHVEMNAQVGGSVSMSSGGTGAPVSKAGTGGAATASAATPAPQAAAASAVVTEVRSIGVRPAPKYQGPYPASFEFVFSITASGPTTVKYVLVNQADRAWNSGELVFEAAGTKEVRIPVKVGVPPGKPWEGWAKLLIAAPNKIESEQVKVTAETKVP